MLARRAVSSRAHGATIAGWRPAVPLNERQARFVAEYLVNLNLFGSHSPPLAASSARVSEPHVRLTAAREQLTVSSPNAAPLGAGILYCHPGRRPRRLLGQDRLLGRRARAFGFVAGQG